MSDRAPRGDDAGDDARDDFGDGARDGEVVVVGAGPVGLSVALGLARAGTPVRVLERRPTPSDLPRAHVVNGRTMEIFRAWGVADGVRADGLPADRARAFAWVTEIRGEPFARIEHLDPEAGARCGPEALCSCPQDDVERRLAAALAALPAARVQRGREVVGYRATAAGAELDVRRGGTTELVRARYVVAADGAGSPLRRMAGVAATPTAPVRRQLNIYFHADLARHARHRPFILWFVHNVDTQGVMITMDGERRWVYSVTVDGAEGAEHYPAERCAELVRAAVGDRDLAVDVRARAAWDMDMAVAATFRAGPLFFAGDAAHRFPPTGGFGMNSGIQDAHNLAWKLDLVLRGAADEWLLDSYDAERRPVATYNATQSMANARTQARADAELNSSDVLALLADPRGAGLRADLATNIAGLSEQFHSLGQQFGFVYRGPAIVDDGSPARDSTIAEYRVTARPGARAPHVPLRGAAGPTSPIDLVAGRFTVLAAQDAGEWRAALRGLDAQVAPAPRVLEILDRAPEHGLEAGTLADAGPAGAWRSTYELDAGGAVLVRPDGHVLARWRRPPRDHAAELARALTAGGLRRLAPATAPTTTGGRT